MRDTCVETIFHKMALFWHSGHTVYLSCHPVHIHSLPPNQCCIFNPQVFLQLQITLIQGWINGDLCHLNRIVCYRIVTKISSCRVNTTSTVGPVGNQTARDFFWFFYFSRFIVSGGNPCPLPLNECPNKGMKLLIKAAMHFRQVCQLLLSLIAVILRPS